MVKQRKGAGRHEKLCAVCQHAEKDEIEAQWKAGRSSRSLGRAFKVPKDSMSNHARYFGLQRDLEAMLYSIIESGYEGLQDRSATAAHMNEAIKSLAKLRGEWIDRSEMLPPGWAGRSDDEIAFFAENGRFPQRGELEEGETVQ